MSTSDNGFDPESVPVCFSMALANGPTSARFCYEAAAVLGKEIPADDLAILEDEDSEYLDEVAHDWTAALDEAGYYVWWSMGDVVVYDLRNLSDDEREAFYAASEDW